MKFKKNILIYPLIFAMIFSFVSQDISATDIHSNLSLSEKNKIIEKKMEYAKKLLETTDINILDIAIEIGYENPSKFSIAFKKIFGILPNKYRKKIKS